MKPKQRLKHTMKPTKLKNKSQNRDDKKNLTRGEYIRPWKEKSIAQPDGGELINHAEVW